MPAVYMLVPFVEGMEGKGFHSYEEAEEKHIPFLFPDSPVISPLPEISQPDASEENEG